jgi:predicted secreted protein
MNHLNEIAHRHGRDRWRDAVFIGVAVLLTALAIGATTSTGVGRPGEHTWSVIVVDPDTQTEMR